MKALFVGGQSDKETMEITTQPMHTVYRRVPSPVVPYPDDFPILGVKDDTERYHATGMEFEGPNGRVHIYSLAGMTEIQCLGKMVNHYENSRKKSNE